jgi:predicted ArsR family transcriptional regulator
MGPRRALRASSLRLTAEETDMKKCSMLTAFAVLSLLFASPVSAQDSANGVSAPAAALKQDMRKLWTDHVVWTRAYVVAAVDDRPEARPAAARLMKNQEDIGNAVGTYYGAAAGQQLTTLLKDHINIAVDLVKAAKAGDKAAQDKADRRWQDNATQIADFLSKANPNWPRATLVDMMKMHLATTTTEVVARLKKDWEGDVRAYDAVYDHILKMADALSDGIIKQFPDKFGGARTDR